MKLAMRPSFRKSKKDAAVEEEPAEVTTTPDKVAAPVPAPRRRSDLTPNKVPRRGVLGKMGMKKKEKVSLIRPPQSKNVQDSVAMEKEADKEEPAAAVVEEEEPAAEPMETTETETKEAEDAPMDEEPVVKEEEDAVEEREEEDLKEEEQPAMEPAPEQTDEASAAPVQEEQSRDERDQPEEQATLMNNPTGFLCGCV